MSNETFFYFSFYFLFSIHSGINIADNRVIDVRFGIQSNGLTVEMYELIRETVDRRNFFANREQNAPPPPSRLG